MNMISLMKKTVLAEIVKDPVLLIGLENKSKKKTLDTGEVQNEEFLELSVEMPRGRGFISRARFEVKVIGGEEKVTQEQLDEGDYLVTFVNLAIKFIDGQREKIYFAADDYEIKEVE